MSAASNSEKEKENIVVVGAGGAGTNIVRKLAGILDLSKYQIVVVNPHTYYIHLVATARMVVSDAQDLENRALIPLDPGLFATKNGAKAGKLVVGKVKAIKPSSDTTAKGAGEIELEDGQTINYRVLVLTPGSIWPGPLNFPSTDDGVKQFIAESRSKIEKAQNIVCVGGGAVGSEISAEIKEAYPKKNVTLVHGEKLLTNSTYSEKFRRNLEKALRAKGVEVVAGEYVDQFIAEPEDKSISTRSGKKIDADLVLYTTGPRPNTAFIGASLGPDSLTSTGTVKILPTLQLPSHSSIFAAGDVIDWPEQKQVAKAAGHSEVICANILALLAGQPESSYKRYKGASELIVVTVGSKGGAGYFGMLGGIVVGNWFSAMVKSKELFVAQARKGVNAPA